MKVLKLSMVLLLCLLVVISVSGCNFDIVGLIDGEAAKKEEAIPKIAFGDVIYDNYNGIEELIAFEDFNASDIEYDIYRSDFHYSKLTENEKFLYHCFEYALEKGYPCIYFDDLIVPTAESFPKVLEFLALDSPLLEQNLIYEIGNFTTYYEIGLSRKAKLDGIYLYIENSNHALWDGKLEAINRAKQIVESMPEGLGETEKAEYLHRYTVENAQYHDYTSTDGVWQYLHDAVVGGKSNCDGSANMLSLLLNVAGIDCYEKKYTGENIVGHTWNMAKLDGKWYNLDATARNKNQTDNIDYYLKRNFAFEDRLQRFIPDYSEIYPAVTEGFGNGINTHFEELDITSFITAVKSAFAQNGDSYAVLLVDNYDENVAETAMQRLADSLKTKVSWYCYDVIENRTVIVVYA